MGGALRGAAGPSHFRSYFRGKQQAGKIRTEDTPPALGTSGSLIGRKNTLAMRSMSNWKIKSNARRTSHADKVIRRRISI